MVSKTCERNANRVRRHLLVSFSKRICTRIYITIEPSWNVVHQAAHSRLIFYWTMAFIWRGLCLRFQWRRTFSSAVEKSIVHWRDELNVAKWTQSLGVVSSGIHEFGIWKDYLLLVELLASQTVHTSVMSRVSHDESFHGSEEKNHSLRSDVIVIMQ